MTPTSQSSQLNLNQINQSHNQKPTSKNRSKSRNQSSQPQTNSINFCSKFGITLHQVISSSSSITTFTNIDDVFDSQSDEAREKEGAEGVDMVGHKTFSDWGSSYAGGVVSN